MIHPVTSAELACILNVQIYSPLLTARPPQTRVQPAGSGSNTRLAAWHPADRVWHKLTPVTVTVPIHEDSRRQIEL